MGFKFEDIKANPVFWGALIVAVIGIVIAAYGHFSKKQKWITFTGLGVMVAALLVAVIAHFRIGMAPLDNGLTSNRCPSNAMTPTTRVAGGEPPL